MATNRNDVAVAKGPFERNGDAVDLGAIGGSQIVNGVTADQGLDLGVTSTDVGVIKSNIAFGKTANDQRVSTKGDLAIVGQSYFGHNFASAGFNN